jgi:AraC-like DNA-binding protein
MNSKFETFKPTDNLISKYIDYYYLDLKPDNKVNTFTCFPHFNNSISIYKSHVRNEAKNEAVFDENAAPMQLFTPIREEILQVKQIGFVHRIVIVFNPLGINHFLNCQHFKNGINDVKVFTDQEMQSFFATTNPMEISRLLDDALVKRLNDFENVKLEKVIQLMLDAETQLPIEHLASAINISSRHLNRLFNKEIGISAKRFQEIVVFRKALSHKIFENPSQKLTTLAHEFNYSDHSHLIKSFKKLTRNTPKDFFEKGKVYGKQDIFWH